jgi:hypothetical protein
MKKKIFFSVFSLFAFNLGFSQTEKFWKSYTANDNVRLSKVAESSISKSDSKLFELNYAVLKQALFSAPNRFQSTAGIIISIPNVSGKIEHFKMYETSNFDAALQARFPNIRSYIGIGVEDTYAQIRLSISPEGVSAMTFRTDNSTEFIEKYAANASVYAVYNSDRKKGRLPISCSTADQVIASSIDNKIQNTKKSSAGRLLVFRLAMSCTAEYTAFHGGTVAGALAAVNATMTRVNGVFEKDFAIRMNLVNNTTIIYTNASTDPYGATDANYNNELQSALTANVGEGNYDVGHLLSATGGVLGNGNAGCIGCVCVNNEKGSGFTTRSQPVGDAFDIDFVAHELGHQFGANHSFSHGGENNAVNFEVGSGSTIMGYAGITAYDVQPNSDDHFHAGNIAQVQANMATKTCPSVINITHSAPVVNAGSDYTIPKSTPFVLKGAATDAGGGSLTYCWEQYDDATTGQLGASSGAAVTKTAGPNWKSYSPTSATDRYFPRLSSVIANQQTTQGAEIAIEALSSVARILNFRLTVRDNVAGGGQTNFDNTVVTVNATAGPFVVNSPNTAVSYARGSSQTVTWAVAGTTANGVNCANVDILLSTDGGNTYPITLLAGTPNDGTQAITIPNTPGTTNRIMVKGSGHVFFDISNVNFTIGAGSSDTVAPTAPTNLVASGTTVSSTNLSWTAATDNIAVTGYDVFRGTILIGSTATTTFSATGLTAATAYSFSVKAKDAAGNISVSSNVVNVTTLTGTIVTYCTSTSTNTADERIARVVLGTINNASTGTAGYENFTDLSTNLARSTSNTITITPFWTGTVYSEGYGVWIDYNKNGLFTDAGELVYSRAASTATPISGTFTIPATAALGTTRMRVSMRYNATPTSCGSFTYGQVEDYTVNIVSNIARQDVVSSSKVLTFNLYPNPVPESGDVLNISSLKGDATFKILNVLGQEVSKGKIDNETLSVANLKSGTYLLEVSSNEQTVVKRFVKE